ncbi:hypothetical protein OPV22_002933 [Ensete ventricosum]|uniref:RRM domain-containing protein n=1 Tax=Ensete ventricosum TaxID=4639 RepID=A0AAV8RZH9_ENSVE|nr:hypothetical protein OPV22_002933 [Ensete ventricosum]
MYRTACSVETRSIPLIGWCTYVKDRFYVSGLTTPAPHARSMTEDESSSKTGNRDRRLRYGKVDRVDMKSGFAFIYMDDERDAEDAIRGLDRLEFGRHGRRLRVEWTKQERNSRMSGGSRRPSANTRPSKTLFVINFDPIDTRTRDLERHFEPYGKISNVRIRRNFGFVQFDLQEDATKALEATHMSKLMDRVISVEYAVRDDDERRNGCSPDRRGRERSRSRDRGRSLSPYGRRVERASPDYGRGPSPYTKADERVSPKYERARSPAHDRDYSRSP